MRFARAVAHASKRMLDAQRFRRAKLNHAMAEGSRPVPQRPVFPPRRDR